MKIKTAMILNRCLGRYTQNSNESFNSFDWSFRNQSKKLLLIKWSHHFYFQRWFYKYTRDYASGELDKRSKLL